MKVRIMFSNRDLGRWTGWLWDHGKTNNLHKQKMSWRVPAEMATILFIQWIFMDNEQNIQHSYYVPLIDKNYGEY